MMRKLLWLLALTLLAVGGWWYVSGSDRISDDVRDAIDRTIARTERLAEDTRTAVEKTVKTPPPLRGPLGEANAGDLTEAGVFDWTNQHRGANGRAALSRDAQLDAAAELKLQEMFDLQYFAHVSPEGEGPADKVEQAGYAFIAVGENLALGGFRDDAALVQAWMDSPGHRENILAESFTEIGIAVGRGEFEGQTTWLAVQMFGRPLSDCPQPDANLAAEIEANKSRLRAMQEEADMRRAEIESTPEPKNRRQADAYNRKVDEYNALVRSINELIETVQGQITVYNGQIQAFNACAKD